MDWSCCGPPTPFDPDLWRRLPLMLLPPSSSLNSSINFLECDCLSRRPPTGQTNDLSLHRWKTASWIWRASFDFISGAFEPVWFIVKSFISLDLCDKFGEFSSMFSGWNMSGKMSHQSVICFQWRLSCVAFLRQTREFLFDDFRTFLMSVGAKRVYCRQDLQQQHHVSLWINSRGSK